MGRHIGEYCLIKRCASGRGHGGTAGLHHVGVSPALSPFPFSMKSGLSRPEKIALIKSLAQKLDVKQRQRIPIDPHPPAPPPTEENRARALELKDQARHLIK